MSDLISRQDAIDAVRDFQADEAEYHYYKHYAEEVITSLPSADADMSDYCDRLWKIAYERGKADRPTGKWIKSNILPNGWHCSHCDAPVMTDDIGEMLFCPHCGCPMKGGGSDG